MEPRKYPKKQTMCAAISPNTYALIRGLKQTHPLKYVNIKQILEIAVRSIYDQEKMPIPEEVKRGIKEKIIMPEEPKPSMEEETPALDEITQDTI